MLYGPVGPYNQWLRGSKRVSLSVELLENFKRSWYSRFDSLNQVAAADGELFDELTSFRKRRR